MFSRNLFVFLSALGYVCNTAATSSAACKSAEACKSLMSHHFQIQYQSLLTSLLSECLYALENAATDLGERSTVARAKELHAVIDNPRELNPEKLAKIIKDTEKYWMEMDAKATDKMKIEPHEERVRLAIEKLARNVIEAFDEATIGLQGVDMSSLPDYETIYDDVKCVIAKPERQENQALVNELMFRVLKFCGVDRSLSFDHSH